MRLLQQMFAEVDATINNTALEKNSAEVIARAEDRICEKFGLPKPPGLPQDIKNGLLAGWGPPKDPAKLETGMRQLAQFISYLGDCGTQGGVFGAGPGTCNDANHKFPGNPKDWTEAQLMEDFEYYKDDDVNAGANSNLADGDIRLLEAAFGWEQGSLGITGSSSMEEVVNAAMSAAGNDWANQIKVGAEISTKEMCELVASGGYGSQAVIDLLGPAICAKIMATYQKIDQAPSMEEQAFSDLGLPSQIPSPEMIDAVRNGRQDPKKIFEDEIKKWEEKLAGIGDDAQLANVDLQNVLQKQQQTLQMMSNISKMLYDTAQSVIRKMGG